MLCAPLTLTDQEEYKPPTDEEKRAMEKAFVKHIQDELSFSTASSKHAGEHGAML